MKLIKEVPCEDEGVKYFEFQNEEGATVRLGVTEEEVAQNAQNTALPEEERDIYRQILKQGTAPPATRKAE